MSEPLTAAEIIKMIHPDLPPATAHFLLNEAKPLLECIEAQAEYLANYKQLATTAIDDAVALRAQLAALQCGVKMVPLTAKQISDAIYKADAQHDLEFMTAEWPVVFTRVIESAHGIESLKDNTPATLPEWMRDDAEYEQALMDRDMGDN